MHRRRDFSGSAFTFTIGDSPLPRVKVLLPPWTLRVDCQSLLPPHDVPELERLGRGLVRSVDCCEIRLVYPPSLHETSLLTQSQLLEQPSAELIDRLTQLPQFRFGTQSDVCVECFMVDPNYSPFLRAFSVYRYSLPSGRCVHTREASESTRSSGLASHRLYGVDNTGNVRVWQSELLLLRLLVSQPEIVAGRYDKMLLEYANRRIVACLRSEEG